MARIVLVLILSFVAPSMSPAAFPFGTTITGTVDGTVTQDHYTYTADATDRIVMRMLRTSGDLALEARLQGLDANCAFFGIGPVGTNDQCAVTAGTTYEVTVPTAVGSGKGSGSYQLFFQSLGNPVGAQAISPGETLTGSISQPAELDTFTLQVQPSDSLLLRVTRTSGTLDPEIKGFLGSPNTGVLGSSTGCGGAPPDSPTDNPMGNFVCNQSADGAGTIVVLVGDRDDSGTVALDPIETGDYSIELICNFGPCASGSSSTTTTTTPGSSTTTTLALTIDQLVTGQKLTLKDNLAKPAKKLLSMLSKDSALTLGGGNGSADDPRTVGAALRVVSSTGDTFDTTYLLPAAGWSRIGAEGANKGYKFAGGGVGAIKTVTVKPKFLAVSGKGSLVGHSLQTNPNPVRLALTMGGTRYCLSFDGTVAFKANKRYLAKGAAAPGGCP